MLADAAAPYVAVRITNLRDIDIANLRWDFDLTFAALLMHPDGTIYHRYGGRGAAGSDRYLSIPTLVRLLQETVPEHEAYSKNPDPPALAETLRAIDLPVLKRKTNGGQRIDCVHCHTVHDAEARHEMLAGTWRRDDAYVFPDPARVGITLDPMQQSKVIHVAEESSAAEAGLQAGDELVALGVQPSVRTFGDVQWALHNAPFQDNQLSMRVRRGSKEHTAKLSLKEGWKRSPPREYAWRPLKWNLSPAPGFGGSALTQKQRRDLGIAERPFAMRVTYFIDWGELKARGQAARTSGLKKGDIVIGFAGKQHFDSFDHLHAHCALTFQPGDITEIEVWRDGAPVVLSYRLPK